MKLARLLLVMAILALASSVALADSAPTDPLVKTQGCGGKGQPVCDANILTDPSQVLAITLTFMNNVASDAIINESGKAVSYFTVSFDVPSTLDFEGCVPGGFFVCTQISAPEFGTAGTAVYSLSGASLCSTDKNDWSINGSVATKVYDGDADDYCQSAFDLELITGPNENIPNGTQVTGSVAAPEPSSALLLLFGLSASFLAFKRFSA